MAVCEYCGKRPQVGMNVSHAHNRTKRVLKPNLQKVRATVCARAASPRAEAGRSRRV